MDRPAIVTCHDSLRQGAAVWQGAIAIERQPGVLTGDTLCRVMSARRLELNGRRAIVCEMPWSAVKQFFIDANQTDSAYAYAELYGGSGGHLQLIERATKRQFFATQEALTQ